MEGPPPHPALQKITWNPTTQTVIYRSKRHHNTKRNFEIFKAPDSIAAALLHLPNTQVSRAGLERDIFEPAAVDLLAEASQGNPRTLDLLAQAAWLAAARASATSIQPEHVHIALRQVPAANAKHAAT